MIRALKPQDTKWISEIAEHLFEEFEDEFKTLSEHQSAELLNRHLKLDVAVNPSKLPMALVMHNEDDWIGVAIMDSHDMGMKPELGPWLTFFYIQPKFRGQGYAKKLLQEVNQQASKFTNNLYLWCFTQKLVDFYKKRAGFELFEKVAAHGNRTGLYVLRRSFARK